MQKRSTQKETTTIYFVRYGHVHNPQNIYYGRLPGYALSQEGHRQAQAAQDFFRNMPLAAIFSSPQRRAQQTAATILKPHPKLTLITSLLIDEVYTPFDGDPLSKLAARKWDLYTGIDSDYEQPVDILNRSHHFMAEVRQHFAGHHVVAVTHGDVIAFTILWATKTPLNPIHKGRLAKMGVPDNYPAPASISSFVYSTADTDELPVFEYTQP